MRVSVTVDSAEEAAAADQGRVEQLRAVFDARAKESHPQWYTEPADPLSGAA